MARTPPTPRRPDFDAFVADATTRLARVQVLLRAALVAVLPKDTGARACGRALGVARNLGWQAWSIAFAPDAATALSRLPGPGGWSLLCAALATRGRPTAEIEALRAAVAELEQAVASSSTSVTLMRSMSAGGLSTAAESAAMAKARRVARTASETMQGVRCGLNAVASIVGPIGPKHRFDLASASVFEGLARSRPGRAWPFYRWSVQASPRGKARTGGRALSGSTLRPLLPDLSSPKVETLGEIRGVDRGERTSIEFVDLDPSRTDGLRLAFAEAAKNGAAIAADDEVPAVALVVTVPVEVAVFDLLLHRSIPQRDTVAAALYAPFDPMMWVRNSDAALPVEESCRLPLEREPRVVESLRLPAKWRRCSDAYGEAVGRAVAALGRDLSEFSIIRIEVPDPPLHGLIVLRWRRM